MTRRTWAVAAMMLLGPACLSWLWVGAYSDREFGGLRLFAKHRLSTRVYFHAPLGESDTALSSLSIEEQRAEEA